MDTEDDQGLRFARESEANLSPSRANEGRKQLRKLIFGCLALAVALAVGHSGALNAWFSDVEVSSGNTFTAGTWKAKPSLSLDPDDAKVETGERSVSHSIWVSNRGKEEIDVAANVELNVSVVEGEEKYVSVSYDPEVGHIPAGEAKDFSLVVQLIGWEGASEGEEVKLRIEVTREDNWSEHNVGRRAHFTIIKSE